MPYAPADLYLSFPLLQTAGRKPKQELTPKPYVRAAETGGGSESEKETVMSAKVILICGKNFYAEKFGKRFEFPDRTEIYVWYKNTRNKSKL